MNRVGLVFLIAAVVLAPVFFGSVHTWAYTMVFGLVLVGALLVVLSQVGVDGGAGKLAVSVPLIAMTVVVPVVVLMGALQMAPLPVWLVKAIQPKSVFHATMGLTPDAAAGALSSVSLAPYRWPVRQSIVRWIVYGMLYWGLVQSLTTRRRIEAAVWMILGIAALESLYGMFEAFSGSHRVLWYGKSAYPGSVSGTYINRNHFAGLMEMTLPLAFCAGAAVRVGKLDAEAKIRIRRSWLRWLFPFISGRHGGEKRILLLVLGIIIGLGLIGSASRGGILGALAGLAVVGLLFLRSAETRRKGWGMLVVLAVLGLVSFRVDVETVLKRFERLQSSIEVRYRYTRQTLQLTSDFPVAGVGLGNFHHAYPHYQSAEDKDYFIDFAHNDWAQLAAELGWGGLAIAAACAVALVAELLWRWWRRSRSWALSLGAAGIGAAIAMAVHSWSDFNLHIPANAMMLVAVLAVGHASLVLERHRDGYVMAHRVWRAPLQGWGGVALVVILGMIAWAGMWTVRHALAESHCRTVANSTLRKPPPVQVPEGLAALRYDPENADTWFKLGLAFAALQTASDEDIDAAAREMAGAVQRLGEDIREGLAPVVAEMSAAAGSRKRQLLNHAAIDAWGRSIRRNPFEAHTHLTLGWAYCRYPDDPTFEGKWLELSETCMKRSAYAAPVDPYVQESLGNYWVMRAGRIDPNTVAFQVVFNKALHHYRTVLNLMPEAQRKKTRDRMIQTATRYGLKFESLVKIGKM